MKLPDSYNAITLSSDSYDVPYPPLGFCPIAEHQFWNGDTFGLYWPIGKEDCDPIVVETYHDEWSIQPHFSSLDRFLVASTKADGGDGDYDEDNVVGTPTLEEDPRSPAASLNAARAHLKTQNFDAALASLETAVAVLPEYTDAQSLLCAQYRRVGRNDAAVKAAIQAILSPPCFGARPVQVARWLSRQSSCPEEINDDPIWINRERLTLKYGGVKENDEYKILRSAVDYYLDTSRFIAAITLMQTYAQLMYSETVSFRDRYGFVVKDFVSWQREVAASRYGKSRVLRLPE